MPLFFIDFRQNFRHGQDPPCIIFRDNVYFLCTQLRNIEIGRAPNQRKMPENSVAMRKFGKAGSNPLDVPISPACRRKG